MKRGGEARKKGISAVVAVVLMLLITIAAIMIVWFVILPIFKSSIDIGEGVDLSIVTLEGYTVWDNSTKLLSVQVERGNDNSNLTGIQFIFATAGNSVTKVVNNVPAPNQKKIYRFNLAETFTEQPDSISIAPIFANNVTGVITAEIEDIPKGNVTPKDVINVTVNNTYTYYGDVDIDGYGNATNTTSATSLPAGYLSNLGNGADCNDNDANKWKILQVYVDSDGDGYGSSSPTEVCSNNSVPNGYSNNNLDCNDADITINPGIPETYNNGVDENCDGGANLNQCGVALNLANTVYFLDNDATATTNCFTIFANGITLDLKGHRITGGNNQNYYGISIQDYNQTTVMNGFIYDFGRGVYSIKGYNGNFTNLNITASGNFGLAADVFGIYISGDNNYITNNNVSNLMNTGSGGGTYGIYLESSSNNILTGNTVNSNTYYGIFLSSSSDNNLNNNRACSNTNRDFSCTASTGTTGIGNTFGSSSTDKVTECSGGWPAYPDNYDYCT